MKVIGLTGGTGSGKSTVAAYLKGKGCHIIDADKISRELTAKGGEALGAIMSAFGQDVFLKMAVLTEKNWEQSSLMILKSSKSSKKLSPEK